MHLYSWSCNCKSHHVYSSLPYFHHHSVWIKSAKTWWRLCSPFWLASSDERTQKERKREKERWKRESKTLALQKGKSRISQSHSCVAGPCNSEQPLIRVVFRGGISSQTFLMGWKAELLLQRGDKCSDCSIRWIADGEILHLPGRYSLFYFFLFSFFQFHPSTHPFSNCSLFLHFSPLLSTHFTSTDVLRFKSIILASNLNPLIQVLTVKM